MINAPDPRMEVPSMRGCRVAAKRIFTSSRRGLFILNEKRDIYMSRFFI